MGQQSLAALKATNKDFNNVLDSMMNLVDGGTVAGGSTLKADAIDSNYIKFACADWNGLTISTKSDANVDSGFTMAVDTFYEAAWDGAGASAIVLPAATPGALSVFRFTAQADGGANIVFSAASGEFFAAQTLNTDVTNFGDAHPHGRWIKGTSMTQTVATFGGAIVTIAATHNTLTIAATATDNQTNIGAELGFYCETAGYWRLGFKGSELGSGAINATFATTAV